MATLQTLPDATTVLPAAGGGPATPLAMRSFLYAVFKHRWLVLGVFSAVFLGSAVAAFLRESKWLASSKVIVKLGETVQLAPAEAPSRSVAMPMNQEVVKTEADIVKSREVVAEAVRRMGIQPEEGSIDQLIDGLQAGLSVTQTPGTNILQISFLGRQPEKAARMVNEITDVYLDHHNRVYRREGMFNFYNEQLRILEAQMKNAQGTLRSFLARHNVVDADEQIKLLAQDEVEQEKGLRAHQAKIAALERKLVEVRRQLAETPSSVPYTEEYQSNPAILTYKAKLAELEIDLANVAQRYQPSDRHVRDMEAQIAEVRRDMAREQGRLLSKQTVRKNELYTELQRIIYSVLALLEDAKARKPALERRLKITQKRMRRLRDVRFTIDNLEQQADQKKYAFDLYWKKHEEARAVEALAPQQSMVSISVVQHATPPLSPQNSRLMPLLLGLVSGLGLATAMAVGLEYLNRRLRFEEEVERYLELPVLAVIPDLERAPDFARA
jgi:succinoglycan biosynthesis transport protein ExoP